MHPSPAQPGPARPERRQTRPTPPDTACPGPASPRRKPGAGSRASSPAAPGSGPNAAEQIVDYLCTAHAALGALPDRDTVVLERFFDESGGMQLVIHSRFGSRLNRAWGLALRKRFCRKFNFELQAAATEDAIVLSLGEGHSFALDEVGRYLSPETVRDVLTQAVLDAPMFDVRWRWNANVSLAIPRFRGGAKVPPNIQRMQAEDLVAAVFPDQLACVENLAGPRAIPDHPLVEQTIADALTEAMDVEGLQALVERLAAGGIRVVARDLTEPSPLAAEVLDARPYAFLDDAPLEERRARAVSMRRGLDPASAADIGRLDPGAIDRVREEAWPEASTPDEMHDALAVLGFATAAEVMTGHSGESASTTGTATQRPVDLASAARRLAAGERPGWSALAGGLVRSGRATRYRTPNGGPVLWCAAERLALLEAALPGGRADPPLALHEELRTAPGRDPVQDRVLLFLAELPERRVHVELVVAREGLQQVEVVDVAAVPATDGAVRDARRRVADDEGGVEELLDPEPVAFLARPHRVVEGEQARLQLADAVAALGAGEAGREDQVVPVPLHEAHGGDALGEVEGRLERFGEALLHVRPHAQAVHDGLDGVLLVLVEGGRMVEVRHDAVDPGPYEAVGRQLVEHVQVLALAVRDHRGEQHDAAALRQRQDLVHHLAHGLRVQRVAMGGAARLPDAGEEEAQIVVDLRDRPHRRARVVGGGLLLDGDGRGQALDVVDVGLLHHRQELSGVGGQGLHVASLALGVQGVEGEGRLARSREPGDHDQAVAWNVEIDVLEVVRARAAHRDRRHRGWHSVGPGTAINTPKYAVAPGVATTSCKRLPTRQNVDVGVADGADSTRRSGIVGRGTWTH